MAPTTAIAWSTRTWASCGKVPSTAAETGQAQNQFVLGKGRDYADVDALVITDTEGNLVYSPSCLYLGTNVEGYASHAESMAVSDAVDWLLNNAEPGENYAVHVITEYQPCRSNCAGKIKSGYWGSQLQNAASFNSANAGLFVWHHLDAADGGFLRLYYP